MGENWYQISAKGHPYGIIKGTDKKYGQSNYSQIYMAEREKALDLKWADFFPELLRDNNVSLLKKSVLVVGINDGQECQCISDLPEKIVGIDLAYTSLVNGKRNNRGIDFIQASAESLPFANETFDVAFCLRTYQVLTPQQQHRLLEEFKRTVRGKVVISFPAAYLDIEKGTIVKGNLVSGVDGKPMIDEDKPDRDAEILIEELNRMGFHNIKKIKTYIEIFIFFEPNN